MLQLAGPPFVQIWRSGPHAAFVQIVPWPSGETQHDCPLGQSVTPMHCSEYCAVVSQGAPAIGSQLPPFMWPRQHLSTPLVQFMPAHGTDLPMMGQGPGLPHV
jgi:hypothetical protein